MYLIELKRHGKYVYDGALALALQVYVQQNINLGETILMPYICDPKVEIGKFQNAYAEINQDYLEEKNIQLVRRDTGGGAVYCDRGGINICFVTDDYDTNLFGNFKKMYQPVINALTEMGVENIEQSGRNDLLIDGKKVSGAAMTVINDRIYGGHSLLIDIDADAMVNVLNPNRKKLDSKGIQSVRSRVTTVRPFLGEAYQKLSMQEIYETLLTKIFDVENFAEIKTYELSAADWEAIDALAAEKYKNWDWNFGNSPKFSHHNDERFEGVGTIEVNTEVQQGRITKCKIYGDFFGRGEISEVEQALIGTRFEENDVLEGLNKLDLAYYFGNINAQDLAKLIVSK